MPGAPGSPTFAEDDGVIAEDDKVVGPTTDFELPPFIALRSSCSTQWRRVAEGALWLRDGKHFTAVLGEVKTSLPRWVKP